MKASAPKKTASLLDKVIAELESHVGHLPDVAEGSGVPYKTLQKILYRDVKDPGISIVEKLDRYLSANPRGPSP